MFKIIRGILLIIIMIPKAYAIEGFVISGFAGGVYYNQKEMSRFQFIDNDSSPYSYNYSSSGGDIFSSYKVGAGYEFYNFGATFNILHSALPSNKISSDDVSKENFHVTATLASLYYKFNIYSDFVPFIGGSYGLYMLRGSLTFNDVDTKVKLNRRKFMYSAFTGLTYNLTDQIAFGLVYETYLLPKIAYYRSAENGGGVNGSYYNRNKNLTHTLFLNLKYYFY